MTFTTPWGTCMYAKILYGLMNTGAMFQRAMYIPFVDENDKILVIYIEDITIFSNYDDEHVSHLFENVQKVQEIWHLPES